MTIVNHHANHPGFAGVTGLLIGFFLNMMGGATARLVADLADLEATLATRDLDPAAGQARALLTEAVEAHLVPPPSGPDTSTEDGRG